MSVRDAIFPLVFTVSFFSISYKTPVSASSTSISPTNNAIKIQLSRTDNPHQNTPPQPSCPKDTPCP